MLCQNCHKKIANVHYTEIINGNVKKLYLCEDCSRLRSKFNKAKQDMGLGDILASFMGFNQEKVQPNKDKFSCPKCNLTYSEFKKIGKLGCEKCYEVFEDKIEPILKQLHGSVQYKGNVPKEQNNHLKDDTKLYELKKKLEDCVKKEEYEEAAELRDMIKEIEGKNS